MVRRLEWLVTFLQFSLYIISQNLKPRADIPSLRASGTLLLLSRSPNPSRRRRSVSDPYAILSILHQLKAPTSHVHSTLGAFGLNSSIYDAANLSWKLGMCARDLATPFSLLPTYDLERRLYANRVIRASGAYLRFICGISDLPLARLRGTVEDLESYVDHLPTLDGTREGDLKWCGAFFAQNAHFMLGLDLPQTISKLCPPMTVDGDKQRPITIDNGKRAPNPCVCFAEGATGYLYDKMTGTARFHILIFGSDLRGPVRERVARFSHQALGPTGFLPSLAVRPCST